MPDKSTSDQAFTGAIPRFYDRHLGPVIFAPCAQDLVARLRPSPRMRVLEVACGTGIVTAKLCARLPADGRLVATDLNQAMLDHGKSALPADPRLEWRVADAGQLPFPDAAFDAWLCQFGVMFFPDKLAALREARRVLAPGGRLLFNVWCDFGQNAFARIAHETIAGFFPADPPKFYLTPFGWSDERVIADTLVAAGFRAPVIDKIELAATSVAADDFALGLVHGNPIALTIAERMPGAHDRITAAVAAALARNGGARPWRGTLRALVVQAQA